MRATAHYEPGLSFRRYRQYRRDLDADMPVINASILKGRTTIDMKADVYPDEEAEEKSEGKEAFVLGDAVHKAILEPAVFSDPWNYFLKAETKGIDTVKAIQARKLNPDKIVIDSEGKIFERATAIRKAVWGDDHAMRWIAPEGVAKPHTELTGIAPDPDGEFIRKIRIDLCVGIDPETDEMGDYLLDIKTCRAESLFPHRFQYVIRDLGYHVQAAYYLDTDSIIRTGSPDNPRDKYIIVAVESTYPYKVIVYELSKERLDEGRELYKDRLGMLAFAISNNRWEGFQYESPYPI